VGYAQPVSTRLTARTALIGAACGVALLILTWFLAFHVATVRHADQSILRGFYDLGQRGRINSVASFVAHLCNPRPYVYFVWIPVAVALLRRRPRLAVAICAILLGANVTTHLLKPLLAQPRPSSVPGDLFASWPSGHATAAMSFALCAVLAAPPRLRPAVAAAGAAFTVAVCYSFLALGWHFPSDVLGGFLVASTWTLLAVSALLAAQEGRSGATVRAARPSVTAALGPPAAALSGAVLLAIVVALARPHQVASYARGHEAFMVGAAAIGVAALAIATGLMLAVRR
jgi:membrane-associated phospholipid phosphatase